eukprot:TRINITY_DN13425_c0_g1_i1.p1 TRINITY_DN13425_c0_g1~~TRINITY_DN13425_c0_g1_i1.p1  ORF type:complete len:164 (-),score=29.21 TRINITY_DN13425_c0_g1_i1:411-902(-)
MDVSLLLCGSKGCGFGGNSDATAMPDRRATLVDFTGAALKEGMWVESLDAGTAKVRSVGAGKIRLALKDGDKDFAQHDIAKSGMKVVLVDRNGTKLMPGQNVIAKSVPRWGEGTVKQIIKTEVVLTNPHEGETVLKQSEVELCGIEVQKPPFTLWDTLFCTCG